ncbi:hypothetical protein AB1Y20_010449 [Prymnesium parvum]|uniref:ATP-grasp domain-containing protein n=1 Tax=Prymnesium parvum TaxID=97485 RepID=A0AB34ISA5_PRYPA
MELASLNSALACCLCFGNSTQRLDGRRVPNCSRPIVPSSTSPHHAGPHHAGPHQLVGVGQGHTDACTLCALSTSEWSPFAAVCKKQGGVDAAAGPEAAWLAPVQPERLHAVQSRHCHLTRWALADKVGRAALQAAWPSAAARRAHLMSRPSLRGKRVLILEDPRFSAGLSIRRNHRSLRTCASETGIKLDLVRIRENATARTFSISKLTLSVPKLLDAAAVAPAVLSFLTTLGIGGPGVYDGVLSWYDEFVPLADEVATLLKVPRNRRYLRAGAPPPQDKVEMRKLLRKDKGVKESRALAYARIRTPDEALHAVRNFVGFPCFVKPSSGGGGTSGVHRWLFSGRLDTEDQLIKAVRKHQHEGTEAILERYLDGPDVYAETVVFGGKVLACSLRGVVQTRSAPSEEPYTWQWPDMLSVSKRADCIAVATESVQSLHLYNGVYGIQLILDRQLGCSFVEVNMRPTNWPTVHDATFQFLFQTDLWLYAVCALMIAVGADPSPYILLGASPPLQVKASCSGNWLYHMNFFPDELMMYGSHHMDPSNGCYVKMLPLNATL